MSCLVHDECSPDDPSGFGSYMEKWAGGCGMDEQVTGSGEQGAVRAEQGWPSHLLLVGNSTPHL